MDAAPLFISLDYTDANAIVPYFNPGTTGISQANPVHIKWAIDIDAIIAAMGNYDIRLLFESDYPHTLSIENYSILVNANNKEIDGVHMRGGNGFFINMGAAFTAGDNTNVKEHGSAEFFNCVHSQAQINTDGNYTNQMGVFRSCFVIARTNLLSKFTMDSTAVVSTWA